MLTLGAAQSAFMALNHAKTVTGAASHLSRWISTLLSDGSLIDNGEASRLLHSLGSRVDALTPAIGFLVEWSSDKGSCTQEVVFNARDCIGRVEKFIEQTVEERRSAQRKKTSLAGVGAVATGVTEAEHRALLSTLKSLLKDLDFAVASLNLALSVVKASENHMPHTPRRARPREEIREVEEDAMQRASSSSCQSSSPAPSRYISPSCLLRASERMRSIRSGDLVVCYGSFYQCEVGGRPGRSFTDTIREAVNSPIAAPLSSSTPQPWTIAMSTVADVHRAVNSTVSLSTEENHWSANNIATGSSIPSNNQFILTAVEPDSNSQDTTAVSPVPSFSGPLQWEEGAEESKSARDDRSMDPSDGWQDVQVNPYWSHNRGSFHSKSRPLASPSPALESPTPLASSTSVRPWKQLYSQASMKIYRNSARNMYELHISSLTSSSTDLLSRPSSSTLKFDFQPSLEFRSTSSAHLGLLEDAAAKREASGLIDAVFSFEERIANVLQSRFAFMLHGVSEISSSSSSYPSQSNIGSLPVDENVRPLDIAYISRLAMYENQHSASSINSFTSNNHMGVNMGGAIELPLAHTRASDEEIWLLLAGLQIEPQPKPKLNTETNIKHEKHTTTIGEKKQQKRTMVQDQER